jgi:hypothetical protein
MEPGNSNNPVKNEAMMMVKKMIRIYIVRFFVEDGEILYGLDLYECSVFSRRIYTVKSPF